jgi:hypothetical protein
MIKILLIGNIVFVVLGYVMYLAGTYSNIDWAKTDIIDPILNSTKEIGRQQLQDAVFRLHLRCQEARSSCLALMYFLGFCAVMNLTILIIDRLIQNRKSTMTGGLANEALKPSP